MRRGLRRVVAATMRAFTLLEVMVAFTILGLALVAVADLNAGSVKMHMYAKQLAAATLLARGKVLDTEQKLLADGPPTDDQQLDGDFSDEGFPSYKWHTEIVRPKTENMSTQQLMDLIMGALGMGGPGGSNSGSSDPNAAGGGGLMGMLGSLFGGGMPGSPGSSGGSPAAAGLSAGMGGLIQGAVNTQIQTFIDSIGKMLREVRVTVYWPNGDETEKFTVVTHMVLMGAGADVNSAERSTTAAAGMTAGGANTPPGMPGAGMPGMPGMPGAMGMPGMPPIPGGATPGMPANLAPGNLGNMIQIRPPIH